MHRRSPPVRREVLVEDVQRFEVHELAELVEAVAYEAAPGTDVWIQLFGDPSEPADGSPAIAQEIPKAGRDRHGQELGGLLNG